MRMDIRRGKKIQKTIHEVFPKWMIDRVWVDMKYVWVEYNPIWDANIRKYVTDMVVLFFGCIAIEDEEEWLMIDNLIKFPIGRV